MQAGPWGAPDPSGKLGELVWMGLGDLSSRWETAQLWDEDKVPRSSRTAAEGAVAAHPAGAAAK